MVNIDLKDEIKKEVIETGLSYIHSNAEKLVAEIQYFEYYCEYPFKHYDENGEPIEETGDDYDDARRSAFKRFMGSLDAIRHIAQELKKGDENYWNHCVITIEKNGNSEFKFEYNKELEQAEEAEEASLRSDFSDQTHEKSEQNQKGFIEKSKSQTSQQQIATDPMDMSISELIGEMYTELVKNLPVQWHSFQVEGEVFEENGKNAVSAHYRYKPNADSSLEKFNPSNIILPGNVVLYINKKMAADGQAWRKALFTFGKDNNCGIEILEK